MNPNIEKYVTKYDDGVRLLNQRCVIIKFICKLLLIYMVLRMEHNWKKILFFIVLVIPATNQIADYFGKKNSVNKDGAINTSDQTSNEHIRVVVSSQNSEGHTQNDFDMSFLKNLEHEVNERNNKAFKSSQTNNNSNTDFHFTSESNYIESDTKKLAVVRLKVLEGLNEVVITGIIGNEFKTITCVLESKESIPITSGICGEKITEVFGMHIGE